MRRQAARHGASRASHAPAAIWRRSPLERDGVGAQAQGVEAAVTCVRIGCSGRRPRSRWLLPCPAHPPASSPLRYAGASTPGAHRGLSAARTTTARRETPGARTAPALRAAERAESAMVADAGCWAAWIQQVGQLTSRGGLPGKNFAQEPRSAAGRADACTSRAARPRALFTPTPEACSAQCTGGEQLPLSRPPYCLLHFAWICLQATVARRMKCSSTVHCREPKTAAGPWRRQSGRCRPCSLRAPRICTCAPGTARTHARMQCSTREAAAAALRRRRRHQPSQRQ